MATFGDSDEEEEEVEETWQATASSNAIARESETILGHSL